MSAIYASCGNAPFHDQKQVTALEEHAPDPPRIVRGQVAASLQAEHLAVPLTHRAIVRSFAAC